MQTNCKKLILELRSRREDRVEWFGPWGQASSVTGHGAANNKPSEGREIEDFLQVKTMTIRDVQWLVLVKCISLNV